MSYQEFSKYPRFRLGPLNQIMDRTVTRSFRTAGFDITNTQENILRNLRIHGPMNQTKLAECTGQDRNSLSCTLAILKKQGLIEKKRCPSDKRYFLVSISPKGEEVHNKVIKVLEKWRERMFSAMSDDEIHNFVETIERMLKIFQEMERENPAQKYDLDEPARDDGPETVLRQHSEQAENRQLPL